MLDINLQVDPQYEKDRWTRQHKPEKRYRPRQGVLSPARPFFDVTLLGLGTDGHTASLLPEEPVLQERERWVVAVSQGRPEIRITTTYPMIESSRRVAFLVTGQEKAVMLRAILAGGSQVPAARVRPVGELLWFVDQAAADEQPTASRSNST